MKKLGVYLCALLLINGCVKDSFYDLSVITTTDKPVQSALDTLNILCRGNSLTYGSFASCSDSSYPARMQKYYGTSAIVRNQGIPGDEIYFGLLRSFADSITSHYMPDHKNIVIAWEITNELNTILVFKHPESLAIDSTYDRMKRFCLLAKEKGFDVVTGTCIARMGGQIPPTFDSCRRVINQRIKENFPGLGIIVAPLDEAPELSNPLDRTYYNPDEIHLSDLGYKIVYESFLKKILQME